MGIPEGKQGEKEVENLFQEIMVNVRPETIKLLEENIGRIFDDIHQSKILYDPPPRITGIKIKVNK